MTLTDKLIVLGILLTAIGVAFLVLRAELRRLRRPTPPAPAVLPPANTAAAIRSQTVYVITAPDPVDLDATAILRPYRGGRHAAR